jgi:hypothetical protein
VSEFFGLARSHRVVLSFEENALSGLQWLFALTGRPRYVAFGHYDGSESAEDIRAGVENDAGMKLPWEAERFLRSEEALPMLERCYLKMDSYLSFWLANSPTLLELFPFPHALEGRFPWKEGGAYDPGGGLSYDDPRLLDGARSQATDVLAWMVANQIVAGVVDGYVSVGIAIVPTAVDGYAET